MSNLVDAEQAAKSTIPTFDPVNALKDVADGRKFLAETTTTVLPYIDVIMTSCAIEKRVIDLKLHYARNATLKNHKTLPANDPKRFQDRTSDEINSVSTENFGFFLH